MYQLLQEGVKQSVKDVQVRIIHESSDAIRHAIKNARKGELIVTLGDRVREDLEIIKTIRDEINHFDTEG